MTLVAIDIPRRQKVNPQAGNIETRLESFVEFALNPWVCERELAKYGGYVDLNCPETIENLNDETAYGETLPYFSPNCSKTLRINQARKFSKRFEQIKQPCAMKIKDFDELEDEVRRIHKMAFANYVLNVKRSRTFPENCCGSSSRNILFSLFDVGRINAIYAYNWIYDHAYVVMPFTLNDQEGLIVCDPTSDQLWKRPDAPRNNTFVVIGRSFDYYTDWRKGANLYPTVGIGLSYVVKDPDNLYRTAHYPKFYLLLKEAFSNPVDIKSFK